ncbi:M61 family metallopeptidase [Aquariibacter albus]|uniref:M61 family metallopeptidase n=1 Tax=Aquariibacter albus TaxID=2759899 RepID=A0A839HLI1_9BURK|nr:M61 family metallopeptidase [Aquariibacter albus]MBB1160398.1 M61 family metallopeptidase [Aquariibacter albus]
MIRYRIELPQPASHQFHITLTVPQPAEAQVLSLPVWIPGSYLVREFARHLHSLQAEQGGQPCEIVWRDKASWTVHCRGRGALTLRYQAHALDPSVRAAWLDAQRGFFNASSLCLRVHGREAEAHALQLGPLPRGWQVATAMRPAAGQGESPRRFEAADYDELLDHPFELGPFWSGGFRAQGVPHRFVVSGAPPGFDGERLLAMTQQICEAQIAFWHAETDARGRRRVKKPPFEHYVFMLHASDEGYGGLEHRASTALACGRRDLPRRALVDVEGAPGAGGPSEGLTQLLGLISHEYFHTWNVKRLKPAPYVAYDYAREQPTELLWFFEGFTSYYDDLFLVRAGLIDEASYLKGLARTINQVLATPGRQISSVAQASLDAWIKYYRPDENTVNATVSYYTKGALVALALDLTLRREGRGTLDTLMRRLWVATGCGTADPGREGALDEALLRRELAAVAGRSMDAELDAWVHGRGELPLPSLLGSVGLGWSEDAPTPAQRLGARLSESGGQLKLASVLRGGAAAAAGLAPGDELLAVDGWRLGKAEDLALYGAFHGPRRLLAARDRRLLELQLDASGPVQSSVKLSPRTDAPDEARARREAWLGGGDRPR